MIGPSILLAALLLAACSPPNSLPPADTATSPAPVRLTVVLPNGRSVEVELATDEETRQQGLMFRESLAPGKGMLFLFPALGVYPFWMKNTLIPLDIIWIDESRRIVHIARDVPPCRADPCPSYPPPPSGPARYVLELAAGQAAGNALKLGDPLEFRNIDESLAR